MRRIVPVIAAVLLAATFAGSAASAGVSGTWHRNNFGNGHERLICTASSGVWQCRYDSMPGFGTTSNDIGEFTGSAQEVSWCPDWAPEVCAHATKIVVGETVYSRHAPFTLWQELIFTDGDGVAPMYQYIVGPAGSPFPVVCPWYPTWDEALDHDYACFSPS